MAVPDRGRGAMEQGNTTAQIEQAPAVVVAVVLVCGTRKEQACAVPRSEWVFWTSDRFMKQPTSGASYNVYTPVRCYTHTCVLSIQKRRDTMSNKAFTYSFQFQIYVSHISFL